jgi:LysR family hydrogen peroxide-inducible transcriptional activator
VSTYLPTLKQLQYLVALKDHGHFGRAAEASFVTQSTLSAGLRELETLIGVTLVERTRRVVRFTPLGERIAEKARRVLREADELTDMARAAGKPLSGDLRMGVIPTIAPFLLPRLLPRLRSEWPSLKLYLREETSQAACDGLHRGQLDCVLLALPYGCLRDHALAACNRPELRAEATMLGTSLHTMVQMVGNGLGVTMVPQMALDAGILEGTGVTARPLRAEHAYRRIALIWRKGSPREKDFRLLADALKEKADRHAAGRRQVSLPA